MNNVLWNELKVKQSKLSLCNIFHDYQGIIFEL